VSNDEDQELTSQSSTVSSGTWEEFFGFEQPYPNQEDAIQAGISAGEQHGFFVMEGPCGTGKTMAALTTAITLLQKSSKYNTVLIVTAVKQQVQQFVDDLRTINRVNDTSITGVTLTGKVDLCPYAIEGVFDSSVNTECEELRESTANLIEPTTEGSTQKSVHPESSRTNAIQGVRDGADTWWDPTIAESLVRNAKNEADSIETFSTPLEINNETAPYSQHLPTAPESVIETSDEVQYCPFEADWYARNKGSPVGFAAGTNQVVDIEQYLSDAVRNGTCPHRTMGVLLENADVVIGNYNHLFDQRTRHLTESIIDDSTFVIIDEAHRLEDRVRDLLSDTIGTQTIRHARGDLEFLLRYANETAENREQITAYLDEFTLSLQEISRTISFFTDVLGWIHETIDEYLAEQNLKGNHRGASPESIEIPMRDPSTSTQDEFTKWAESKGYDDTFWNNLRVIGEIVEEIHRTINPERSCVAAAIGALFERWKTRDNSSYFREIELEYSPKESSVIEYEWGETYTPRLVQYNCLPRDALAAVFSGTGGGILMSATLEPIDVFRDVSGINHIQSRDSGMERPVIERSYDLPFPSENRASWIIDAPPYTASNRGAITDSGMAPVREHYAGLMKTIAESHGNILLCLPNYAEATWAGNLLSESIQKPVITDYSSSNTAPNKLNQSFFSGENTVLVTSTRGTLTEGVDYDGEKLHTCAVIGLPLVNIGSPRVQAVKHAYGEEFGTDNAFNYALSIPAVRRARQALGRVIRGPDETGIRILVDNRYTKNHSYASVFEYLSSEEQDEFVTML
jgi:DNA excision repair protein ERCC-2